MKATRANLLLILLILSFLLAVDYSSAKPLKSQISLLRDCRLYEESYDGISCRNASFDDIPVCTSDEEIITSPKRGRLCCCIKVTSEEKPNDNGINDCSDVGCKNVSSAKDKKCPSGLAFYEVEGVIPCCCPPGRFEELGFCQLLGCENASNPTKTKDPSSLVCSRSELSITPVSIIRPQNNSTNICCCPGAVAMIEAITCSNYINCRELTGPECTSSFPSFDEINIDLSADGSIDRTFTCCCHAATTK